MKRLSGIITFLSKYGPFVYRPFIQVALAVITYQMLFVGIVLIIVYVIMTMVQASIETTRAPEQGTSVTQLLLPYFWTMMAGIVFIIAMSFRPELGSPWHAIANGWMLFLILLRIAKMAEQTSGMLRIKQQRKHPQKAGSA